MTETKIELSGSCSFTLTTYENIGYKDVCLEYTEHSSDHWHSDIETSISLDADKAREIVAFMQKAFPEIEQPAQREPLTDEQITTIEQGIWNPEFFDEVEIQANREFARAIEAAHGIKEQK